MAGLLSVVSVVGSILLTPLLMLLLCVIFLASIGKSLGVRRLYIKLLLIIFEFGRVNIETAQKHIRQPDDSDEDEGYSEELQQEDKTTVPNEKTPNGIKKSPHNGYIPNGNTVISRDDKYILVPQPPVSNYQKDVNKIKDDDEVEIGQEEQKTEKYRLYDLSSVFDYVKAGVESIIEDQVTSRFEAEELKNWNLLIRTNRRYEFISWKLTVMWVCGFFVRYFFLLPLRTMIFIFGIFWLALTTTILGYLKDSALKRFLVYYAYVSSFRILIRCVSGVVYFHNKQYRPANGSVCVANHTTPIDTVILSQDNAYALVWWLIVCTALVGYVKNDDLRKKLNGYVTPMCCSILATTISAVITHHNEENKPKNGICVANHTSPMDALMLMCDNNYSLIGQRHGGFLGMLQRALSRASPHIWFERSEVKDRHAVTAKLKEHISNPKNPPILIFPEGTCINNTSVMQFKKGSFEVGGVVYPVAIKYDPRFGDAFWNSSKYSMLHYLYMMMTSWAIVCDVWYLPPMYKEEGESSIDFANRVKGVIANQGGLVDLVWDGQLKRNKPKKEWRERQQEEFSKRLKFD